MSHLQPLLSFLHHEPYGVQRRIWEVGSLDACHLCMDNLLPYKGMCG